MWDLIKKDTSILIIHLTRINTLRSYVSLKIAEKTNRWHESINSTNFPSDKKIKIDLEDYLKYCNNTANYIKLIQNQYSKSHDYIELTFEDLVAKNQKSLNRIFDKLKLKILDVHTKMIRQNPESLSNLIINYNEVESFIARNND